MLLTGKEVCEELRISASTLSRLVAESCDFKVSIPMKGQINSLNASAAAAVLIYEAVRQRRG